MQHDVFYLNHPTPPHFTISSPPPSTRRVFGHILWPSTPPETFEAHLPDPERSLHKALEGALDLCNVLVVMLSSASLNSYWVQEEVAYFQRTRQAGATEKKTIVVKIEPCEPASFAYNHMIDGQKQTPRCLTRKIVRLLP